MLYQEAIMIAFAMLIIFLTLYFLITSISGTKTTIEKSAPDLTYKFPASFVQGFLYAKISEEDITSLNLDENKNYYVKDIIYLKGKDSEKQVRKIREEYILEMNKLSEDSGGNMHDYYKEFSKDNYKTENLISISFDEEEIPILENSFSDKNYFYYVKQKNGKYTIIYFIARGINEDEFYSNVNSGLLDKELAVQVEGE